MLEGNEQGLGSQAPLVQVLGKSLTFSECHSSVWPNRDDKTNLQGY